MQLKSILHRVERYKSFVYGKAQWVESAARPTIEVRIEPRANSRPVCSGCGRVGSGHDRLPERRFEFVPLWQIAVFFVYAMRRVDCPRCGVTVEQVPWAEGKCTMTTTLRWFLARWGKRLSWQEVAGIFRVSWEDVFRSVKYAVSWGLAHRDLSGIEAIGVDEIQWQRGHHYLTLVYQIEDGMKRLLWVAQDRTVKLAELLQYNLQSWRSYLLREDFQRFWEYISPGWAAKFLDQWCTRTLRSRIAPMKDVARSLRGHRGLILNWFRARGKVSAGAVEGLNNQAKLTTRKAYGFRTYEGIETALYHTLGALPEPEFTHEFC